MLPELVADVWSRPRHLPGADAGTLPWTTDVLEAGGLIGGGSDSLVAAALVGGGSAIGLARSGSII